MFLTAEWRYLAMLNYRVDPDLLEDHVPAGTALDSYDGAVYVSVVGFLFRNTRVLGLPIPWHRHFEELNLRLYVRRVAGGENRRAVTFIKELVPRRAIAAVARIAYNEPYRTASMSHHIGQVNPMTGAPTDVEYRWRVGAQKGRLSVRPDGSPSAVVPGSEEEYITEHYWGYTAQRDGGTVEYQVQHPRWNVWRVSGATLEGDLDALHGPRFAQVLRDPPASAFLADGSPVAVFAPRRLSKAELRYPHEIDQGHR